MVKKRKIILPEKPEVLNRLQKKVSEYQNRLMKKNSSDNPAALYSTLTGYKAVIAKRLIQRGQVDTYVLSKELQEEYGFIDFRAFNDAAGVIEDYCRTGGKNVRKGTGF